MRLVPARSPQILPPSVASYAAHLAEWRPTDHFAAGRECARRALEQLGIRLDGAIGRGEGGEPLWPEGITGSITHKDDYVWAAVARTSDVLSLGIDAERVISVQRAARIASTVVLPEERSVGGSLMDDALRVVLIFAIKEAVFKCLYPVVRKRFYYDALRVTDLECEKGVYVGELTKDLAPFSAGQQLTGTLTGDDGQVWSAVWLPGG